MQGMQKELIQRKILIDKGLLYTITIIGHLSTLSSGKIQGRKFHLNVFILYRDGKD